MSDSVQPHPWDSPGKNTGVGCHFLLQCIKVKSESEVAQSCLTLCNPMDCSLPGSSVHGIFQARVLEWGAIAFSEVIGITTHKICSNNSKQDKHIHIHRYTHTQTHTHRDTHTHTPLSTLYKLVSKATKHN